MKRRFIAGAICPECEQLDKVVMYDDDLQQRWRECVACGFKDLLIEQSQAEMPTRVNQPLPGEKVLAHETEVNIVSIIDPKKMH